MINYLLEIILELEPMVIVGGLLLLLSSTVTASLCFGYRSWRRRQIRLLNRHGTVTNLAAGRVQYSLIGGGPRIALIFGGAGFGFDAIFLHRYLLPDGIGLLCPSPPGYLQTSLSSAETLEKQVELYVQLLDALGIHQPVALIGVSLGAPAAIQFALQHPERTSCLILNHAICKKLDRPLEEHAPLVTHLLSPHRDDRVNYFLYLSERYWRSLTMTLLLRFSTVYSYAQCFRLARALLADINERRRLREFLDALSPASMRRRGFQRQHQIADNLPELPLENISCPTLVLGGADDRLVPLEQAQYAAANIPGAELAEVSGYGALYWFGEEGRQTEGLIRDFLRRCYASASEKENSGSSASRDSASLWPTEQVMQNHVAIAPGQSPILA